MMDSISEACIVQVPRKKSKNNQNPFRSVNDWKSYKYYEKVWSIIQDKLEEVNKEVCDNFINGIIDFVSSYEDDKEFIPVLTLLTGINLSDNENLFLLLARGLQIIPNHFVALVQPFREMPVKYLIEQVVKIFVYGNQVENDSIEYDNDGPCINLNKRFKRSQCTLLRLYAWYKELNYSDGKDRPCLVIVIPDIASVSSKVLTDFMNCLSEYRKTIRFTLVLGISTNLEIFHQMVPYPILTYYCIYVFESQISLKLLDNILEKVLLNSECPFLLHGEILERLISVFTFYNSSVKAFINGFKLCLMNHFYESEASILCCPDESIPKIVESLNDDQIRKLLLLPSVGIINSKRKEDGLPILEKTTDVKSEIQKYVRELRSRILRFHTALRCLQIFWISTSLSPRGHTLKDLYCIAMKENITKSRQFKEVFEKLPFVSLHQLLENIKTVIDILHDTIEDNHFEEVASTMKYYHDEILDSEELEKLKKSHEDISLSPRKSLRYSVNSPLKTSPTSHHRNTIIKSPSKFLGGLNLSPTKNVGPRKASFSSSFNDVHGFNLSSLNDVIKSPCKSSFDENTVKNSRSPSIICSLYPSLPQLPSHIKSPINISSRGDFIKDLQKSAQSKKQVSELNKIKNEFFGFMKNKFFSESLECPRHYPLHEILLYEDPSHIKEFTSVNPRAALEKALTNPGDILECSCCKLKTSDNCSESWPDICIIYKLYLEASGLEINLHDWLQAFHFKVTKGSEEEISREIYNRFMHSVREFQLLGFIKPLKRKVDHVKKLMI